MLQVGYSGQNFPTNIFPSMVGRPVLRAEEAVSDAYELKDIMCGEEAAAARASLDIAYPLSNGIVKNWDDMEHLWNYTFFEKLQINPTENRILLTEPPMNPLSNRKKLVEYMFEKYGFASVNISIQALMTLTAQGTLTGVVVDSGDGVTHLVAVHSGYEMSDLTRRLDVAGRSITEYLIKLLLLRGYAFNRSADMDTVRQIKEQLCYVSNDPKTDRALAAETTCLVEKYTLPDGRVIKMGRERFEAPEALFSPSLIGLEQAGISDMIFDMIQKASIDLRADFYKHIVLSGGSTMYPGLPTRLYTDIRGRYIKEILKGNESAMKKIKINIEDDPRRKHHVWSGGSIFAEICKDEDKLWITKAEYDEMGVECIRKLTPAK